MNGLIFVLILLVLMVPLFLTTRRQKKMMRQTQETQANLAVGEQVMTTSGMHGEVAGLQESTVDLEIAPGVITRWERIAIRERLTVEADAEDGGDGPQDTDEAGETDDDGVTEQDGFTEQDIEGFSVDDLTPEDFEVSGDESQHGTDPAAGRGRGPGRDGGVTEP